MVRNIELILLNIQEEILLYFIHLASFFEDDMLCFLLRSLYIVFGVNHRGDWSTNIFILTPQVRDRPLWLLGGGGGGEATSRLHPLNQLCPAVFKYGFGRAATGLAFILLKRQCHPTNTGSFHL
jgi:hypothetical protein